MLRKPTRAMRAAIVLVALVFSNQAFAGPACSCPELSKVQQLEAFHRIFGKEFQSPAAGQTLLEANYSNNKPQTNVFVGTTAVTPHIYLHSPRELKMPMFDGSSEDLFELAIMRFNAITGSHFRAVTSVDEADVEIVLGDLKFAAPLISGLSLDSPDYRYFFESYGREGEKRRFWLKPESLFRDDPVSPPLLSESSAIDDLLHFALGLRTKPDLDDSLWHGALIACIKAQSEDDPITISTVLPFLPDLK